MNKPVAVIKKHTGSLGDMAIIMWLGEQPPEGTLLYAALPADARNEVLKEACPKCGLAPHGGYCYQRLIEPTEPAAMQEPSRHYDMSAISENDGKNRAEPAPAATPEIPHKNVHEYGDAFKCLDCGAQWGALPGLPRMPPVCNQHTDDRVMLTREQICADSFYDKNIDLICDQAVAAIDLQAEVERLKQELGNAVETGSKYYAVAQVANAEAERLTNERDVAYRTVHWEHERSTEAILRAERAESALKPVSVQQLRDRAEKYNNGGRCYNNYYNICLEVLALAGVKVAP